jgi:hypothetical protein
MTFVQPVMRQVKNMNPIRIDDEIVLTQHMTFQDANAWPVRYKLVSATYHSGTELRAGHYIAAVTGSRLPCRPPPRQFLCNDWRITEQPPSATRPNSITRNPVINREKSRFDPTILFYERIWPTGAPASKRKKRRRKMYVWLLLISF